MRLLVLMFVENHVKKHRQRANETTKVKLFCFYQKRNKFILISKPGNEVFPLRSLHHFIESIGSVLKYDINTISRWSMTREGEGKFMFTVSPTFAFDDSKFTVDSEWKKQNRAESSVRDSWNVEKEYVNLGELYIDGL